MSHSFTALEVVETDDGAFTRHIITRDSDQLPDGDLLIGVSHSSLNYKDALSATGNKGVTRRYPHTPGIDAAGVVIDSANAAFAAGDQVVVTGYDLGMNTAGGYGSMIRVPADWALKLPDGLSPRQAMSYGTAGVTAALSIDKLQRAGLRPDQGEVLVTGASGGVGSLAVALLAGLGYQVVAGTGKDDAHDFLRGLGARSLQTRDELSGDPDDKRVLHKGRWAGVLDTVGGPILAHALKNLRYGGSASCCGLVASPSLKTTVFPFILRGVNLLGVDSVEPPLEVKRSLWERLAGDWGIAAETLDALTTDITLEDLDREWFDKILGARVRGRVVVKLD